MCFKFKLLSTHVYLTFLAFYILYCVLLGVNLSEKPLWTTFSTRHVRIHLFTVKKKGKIEWSYQESHGRLIVINCYFTFTAKFHIPDWSMIDTKCDMVCRHIVITAKPANTAGCIKNTPLTTWMTYFRCMLRFFLFVTIHTSWEILFKTSKKYQYAREARRFLRIQ